MLSPSSYLHLGPERGSVLSCWSSSVTSRDGASQGCDISLGKQFLSLLTPAIALLEDVKFSPSNHCSETEIPWQNPLLLWEEGTAEGTGTIARTEEGTKFNSVRPPLRGDCGSRPLLWTHTWPGLQETVSNDHLCKYNQVQNAALRTLSKLCRSWMWLRSAGTGVCATEAS